MVKKDNTDLPAIMESQDIFERFEQLDDKVIIQLLEDQVAEAWVYHFKQEGKDIWGIGKAGIDGCAKEMGKKGIALREDSVDFVIDPTTQNSFYSRRKFQSMWSTKRAMRPWWNRQSEPSANG